MTYEVYLKDKTSSVPGFREYWGDLHEHSLADIMYCIKKDEVNEKNDEDEGTKIGNIAWVTYKQALAMEKGINMTNVTNLLIQRNFEALLELDYAHISQETIDEIGAASHPNIVMLSRFFISAAWRNKGIGKEILKRFIEQMKGQYGYIVILHNEPAQFGILNDPDSQYAEPAVEFDRLEKDPEKAQYKLNAFWQRCGFHQFKNYENIFICNVDQAVAESRMAKRSVI
jgi:GNAT superfamily N-acetyltransferase